MSRLVRLTLMWLLALALPLQGVAAASLSACGAAAHEHSMSASAVHAHDAHEGAGAAEYATRKCGSCASCCLNAALPSAAVSIDRPVLADAFAPLVARTAAPYAGGRLERPPRSFLV